MIMIGSNRRLPDGLFMALVVAIVCVGVLYHLLLAHLWSPQGILFFVDHGVHSIVPLLTFLWWLFFSNMSALSWSDSFKAMLWPLVYVVYVLVRAQWSDFYPYPFLNLNELGAGRLVVNIVCLSLVFFMVGLVLYFIARFRCRLMRRKRG